MKHFKIDSNIKDHYFTPMRFVAIVLILICGYAHSISEFPPCYLRLLDTSRELLNIDPTNYAEQFRQLKDSEKERLLNEIVANLREHSRELNSKKTDKVRKLIFALHVALNPYDFFLKAALDENPWLSLKKYHDKLCALIGCVRDKTRFETLQQQIKIFRDILKSEPNYSTSTLVIYGSTVAGTWHDNSDLDVAFSYFPYWVKKSNPILASWNARFASDLIKPFPIEIITPVDDAIFFATYTPIQIVLSPHSTYLEIKDHANPTNQKLIFDLKL